jgi:hypothetical protein
MRHDVAGFGTLSPCNGQIEHDVLPSLTARISGRRIDHITGTKRSAFVWPFIGRQQHTIL